MNSLGKSAKWPSYDSLSSTPSLLLSESEHTEDEADLHSSEGEGDSVGSTHFSSGRAGIASGIVFPFPGHSSNELCRKSGKTGPVASCQDKALPAASAPLPGAVTLGSSSATPGDMAFAQKCTDLQRFVTPLINLLNGLKIGRFDRGLTSFQQSVAMDRLQRILGILQKPDMGEKYLHTLLQVEILLRMWFPQVPATQTQVGAKLRPSRWRQNQLHIPVKKRKMSWLYPDPSDTVSPHYQQAKRHQSGDLLDMCQAVTSKKAVSTCIPRLSTHTPDIVAVTSGPLRGVWASQELTDSSGTLDDQQHLCSRNENGNLRRLQISPPPSLCGSPAMQDGSVSSSSTLPVAESP